MAEEKIPAFVLVEESVNKYGFRMLMSGGELDEFKQNPQLFWNHHRSNREHPDIMPLGKWVDIKEEKGRLTATPEFDEDDEIAIKLKKKVQKGMVNAASAGFEILAISEEPELMLKGQIRPTVTKWRMLEGSLVDIPGNSNCMKLIYKGKEIQLTGERNDVLNEILPIIKLKEEKSMKTVMKTLGLEEGASEVEVLAKVQDLQNQIQSLRKEKEDQELAMKDQKCKALVDKAIEDKKITEGQREAWESLAKNDYEGTEKALKGMTGFGSISDKVEMGENKLSELKELSDADRYDEMWKAEKLEEWKLNDPEDYERCKKARFKRS